MSKKRRRIVATVFVVVALMAWLSIPWFVRREVEKRAKAAGFKAEVEDVSIWPGRIVLTGVKLSTDKFPIRPFRIETVVITTSWVSPTKIMADGATMEVNGDATELTRKFREMRGTGKLEGPEGEAVKTEAKNITIKWTGLCAGTGEAEVFGVRIKSKWSVNADSISASCYGVKLEAELVSINDGKASAKDVFVVHNDTTLQAFTVTVGSDASSANPWNRPWATADTATIVKTGTALNAKDVRASADISAAKARVEAAEAVLKQDGLQSDITATGMTVSLQASDNAAHVIAEAKSVTGAYKAVTGTDVTAKSLKADGKVSWGPNYTKPWRADEWKLRLGTASATVNAELRDDGFTIEAGLGESWKGAECNDLIQSIPAEMVPKLEGFKAEGRVQASVRVSKFKEVTANVSLKNECKFVEWPKNMSPQSLKKKFSRIAYGAKGELIELESGPGSKDWVPYSRMSKFLTSSIQVTEDPGFFRHKGMDVKAIENSIKQDIEAGKFVRGASTVTMQLAKNLWLSRSKTISRKIQEAFLTTYLEQVLTKEEILELYFNVVEFGPGIYGIGPAASKYFGSSPEELTLAQSLFLTSILPNPKTQWFGANGTIYPNRMKWLRTVMETMHKRGLVSDDELHDGLAEELVLGANKSRKPTETGPIIVSPGGLDPDWSH